MKKIFEITKALLVKFVICALLLALLGAGLVSCMGNTQAQKVEISGVATSGVGEEFLTQSDLDKIATFLYNNATAYEAFVAAYRGYNMLEANFDKEADRPQLDVNLDAAIAVLGNYDESKTLNYGKLNADDVKNIVSAVSSKTDINFNANRGFFDNLQYWLGVALGWITNTLGFGNYLVGICIVAVLFEIILLPLGIKQQKNSIKQATLRPKEMAIRKRYAGRNDQATQQKVTMEIQELYQRENFNPMGGCLPLLVQFPIIIILYNVVIDPLRYVLGMAPDFSAALQKFFVTSKAAGGLGETLNAKNGTIEVLTLVKEKGIDAFEGLKDFMFFGNSEAVFEKLGDIQESIPSFNIGPVNLGYTPSFTENYWLLLVPVLTFVVYFFSMKLTRKFTYQAPMADNQQAGCSMKIMDYSMPLMSVFFTFIVPGAVGVYWIFKSVIGTLKQFIITKLMPLPVFTEEDYKAAEKELNAKRPKKKERDADAPRPRSLHHIDDDDYEQPPVQQAKPKKETPIEKAPLKEEEKEEPKEDNK